LAVYYFSEGVFPGEVSVTGFIFDHRAGQLLRRAGRSCPALRREEKADDKIDDISDKDVKDEFKKALNHVLNVLDFSISVKPQLFS